MIVWINGAYGAGKSTTAELLSEVLEESYIFDPEEIGNCVRERKPKSLWKDDFQEYPSWRETTYLLLKELYEMYEGTIIVPMTVLNPDYLDEIIGRLERERIPVLHFILMAGREEISRRILIRGEEEDCWCMRQVDRCVNILGKLIRGIEINTDTKSAKEATEEILGYLQEDTKESET